MNSDQRDADLMLTASLSCGPSPIERVKAETALIDGTHVEIETIRRLSPLLNTLSDDQLSDLYSTWSEETWCAGWIGTDESGIRRFIAWATNAPMERE